MVSKANMDIRLLAKANGVTIWEIAHELGIAANTLFCWLRVPLDPDKAERIREIIETKAKVG